MARIFKPFHTGTGVLISRLYHKGKLSIHWKSGEAMPKMLKVISDKDTVSQNTNLVTKAILQQQADFEFSRIRNCYFSAVNSGIRHAQTFEQGSGSTELARQSDLLSRLSYQIFFYQSADSASILSLIHI